MDYRIPSSSVHGISQARILEWVAISFSRGSSWPKDQTHISWVSRLGRWILHHQATWEAHWTVDWKWEAAGLSGSRMVVGVSVVCPCNHVPCHLSPASPRALNCEPSAGEKIKVQNLKYGCYCMCMASTLQESRRIPSRTIMSGAIFMVLWKESFYIFPSNIAKKIQQIPSVGAKYHQHLNHL